MDTLTFNGVDFATYNTYFDGAQSFVTPDKDIEFVEVPGRNGSLSFNNNRWNDLVIPYPCYIHKDFLANFRSLEAYLNSVSGYQTLTCSKEPNHYRKAMFLSAINPEPTQLTRGGHFTINFRCHPQRWLVSGDTATEFTSTGISLENPTLFTSKPIIRITDASATLAINSYTITVTDSPYAYIDIDCETMDAYHDSDNANAYVSFSTYDTIELQPGTNGIEGANGHIIPRWYEI